MPDAAGSLALDAEVIGFVVAVGADHRPAVAALLVAPCCQRHRFLECRNLCLRARHLDRGAGGARSLEDQVAHDADPGELVEDVAETPKDPGRLAGTIGLERRFPGVAATLADELELQLLACGEDVDGYDGGGLSSFDLEGNGKKDAMMMIGREEEERMEREEEERAIQEEERIEREEEERAIQEEEERVEREEEERAIQEEERTERANQMIEGVARMEGYDKEERARVDLIANLALCREMIENRRHASLVSNSSTLLQSYCRDHS